MNATKICNDDETATSYYQFQEVINRVSIVLTEKCLAKSIEVSLSTKSVVVVTFFVVNINHRHDLTEGLCHFVFSYGKCYNWRVTISRQIT